MAVKKSPKAPAKKTSAIQEKYTKTAILSTISENTGITKKEVSAVLDELSVLIERHIKKRGEFMDIPKKPASTKVRVLPLKKLKEFAL